MSIKIDLSPAAIVKDIKARMNRVQKVFDAQVLKDSNFYCPMNTGTLKKSAILSSVLGSGELVWNTPYAKAQYYGFPHKRHQTNPNACGKWFEQAKAVKHENWEKLVNDEYSKNS